MKKRIVKQLMLVIPDPHKDINSKHSKDIIHGVFNALLLLGELDNMLMPLDTLLIFLDPDDAIESHVYSSINEENINKLHETIVVRNQYEIKDMMERAESLSIGDDGLQQARNYILANYIRNTHHQDRKEQDSNYIEKHVHDLISDIGMLRKRKVLVEKNIFLFPIKMKENIIQSFQKVSCFGSQVSLDIVSDCDNAFRLASKKVDLVLIKENVSGSSGCYSPALLDTIDKDYNDKKNPTVYISMSLPSRSINMHQSMRFMEYYNQTKKNRGNVIYLQSCGAEKDITAFLSIIKEVLLRRKIYVSYGNEDGVKVNYLDNMEKQLRRYFPFTDIEIDKNPDRYMHDLHEYIKRLKNGQIVIALINEKYLYSPWAMDEMVGILESNHSCADNVRITSITNENKLSDRLFVIVMKTARLILDNHGELEKCRFHWKKQVNDKLEIKKIFKNLDVIFDLLHRSYNFSEEDHKKEKFSILSNSIYEQLKEFGYPDIYGSSTHPEFKDALAGKYR